MKTTARMALVGGAMLALAVSSALPASAAVVEIAVTGVVQARGHIHVELCTQDTFLKPNCPYVGSAAATPGPTTR